MNLATFWKSKRKPYRIILKSGATFSFTATNVKLSYHSETGSVTKWEIVDGKGDIPWFCVPSEIVAVIQVGI